MNTQEFNSRLTTQTSQPPYGIIFEFAELGYSLSYRKTLVNRVVRMISDSGDPDSNYIAGLDMQSDFQFETESKTQYDVAIAALKLEFLGDFTIEEFHM